MTAAGTRPIAAFEIGATYSARSACNAQCVWTFTVTSRTAKFITIAGDGKVCRVGVRLSNGVEIASPMGRFSLSPVIFADRPVEVTS